MSNYNSEAAAKKKGGIYTIAKVAVLTALMCVLSPLTIPIGPVPISLSVLVILLAVYILGWKLGTLSVIVYILIGMVGVPVFSGFSGGIGKLLGPTGGYIIGYIPMAVIAGLGIEASPKRWVHFAVMVIGVAVLYAFGTAWLCISAKMTVSAALGVAVYPFIPFDLVKIVIAMIVGPMVRDRLRSASLN
ncbi:MAG: biotin transporter BioY [Oscillospiraceae bacterium]|nr:biotin transporter BioY [Oscillospiraceae bacterium]